MPGLSGLSGLASANSVYGMGGDIYYVDATNGDDTGDGLSAAGAWQTEAAVNGATFKGGDRILFKRGETWALAATLAVTQSGLYFGAYGEGANPILDGQDTVNCVSAGTLHHITFQDIEVTQGLDFGFSFSGSSYVTLINCSAHDCGNDCLLFIGGAHHCVVRGGTYYNAYTRVADSRLISGIEATNGSHDIIIDGVEVYGVDASAHALHYGAGIAIHSHAGSVMPYNITIQNCNIHDQGTNCRGIRFNQAADEIATSLNTLVANNIVRDGAYGGMWFGSSAGLPFRLGGITVRDNIVRLNANTPGVVFEECQDIHCYRNLVVDDDTGNCIQFVDGIRTYCWNNTCYDLGADWGFAITYSGATSTDNECLNNIIGYDAAANVMHTQVAAGAGTNLTIDYNLYEFDAAVGNRWNWLGVGMDYATWLTNNNNDANSPARGDPLFTDPATYDFTLQAGSPAINAGVDVGLPYQGTAPDCGYWEHS